MPVLLAWQACVTHMMPHDRVRITHMNVWVGHTNVTCVIAYLIPTMNGILYGELIKKYNFYILITEFQKSYCSFSLSEVVYS